jgi:hypothetical protein
VHRRDPLARVRVRRRDRPARAGFLYLRLFDTELPNPDPEGTDGVVTSAVFFAEDADLALDDASEASGSLHSDAPPWRWRDDGCWADWSPTIDASWAFDPDMVAE